MADTGKDQDQSMEDILQSIKRIIAEEGEPSPEAGSDVLELTDLLAEDGSITHPTAAPKVESISIDEIMAAPTSSMPPKPFEPAAEFEPAPVKPIVAPEPEPAKAAFVPEFQPEASAATVAPVGEDEPLMSGATFSASVAALNALRDSLTPGSAPRTTLPNHFRSGITVEDLVLEGLRPLLKDWIDHNLVGLVETLVQKEISKLTQK